MLISAHNRDVRDGRQSLRLWSGEGLMQVCNLQHHAVLNSPSASSEAIKRNKASVKGRGRLVDGTAHAEWQNEAVLHRVGQCHLGSALLRIGAFLALVAVLFLVPFAGEARAHGLHGALTVQMPSDWTETTVSQDEAVSAQAGCGVKCCSATGCTAAVLNVAIPSIVIVALNVCFVLPSDTPPGPSPQSTLKRPPRA